MATAESTTNTLPGHRPQDPAGATNGLLVSLASLSPDVMTGTLGKIAAAFPGEEVLVATPDGVPGGATGNTGIRMLPYSPAAPLREAWVLNASDYVNAFRLARDNGARCCLMLGSESQSLEPGAIRGMADAVMAAGADLAMPRWDLGPREGLFNSAMLYPVSRALYGARSRFPLAVDLAVSLRMAEKLAAAGQRFTAANQAEALLWPAAEAAVAGFNVTEVPAGHRVMPQPNTSDLNALLAQIAGSLFADVEAKAAFWQRARSVSASRPLPASGVEDQTLPDVHPMLTAFRVAYTNLYEIWSLVLPPHSLLGLKKLSLMPAESFRLPDALWVRVVYDFVLAYRLRTLNRGHLLGALTPLYLAWVASHILMAQSGVAPEQHIEEVAAAFETDKPYLVSRWRWPDRFNP